MENVEPPSWSSPHQLDSMFGVPQPTLSDFQQHESESGSSSLLTAPSIALELSPPASPRSAIPDYSEIFPLEVWRDIAATDDTSLQKDPSSPRGDESPAQIASEFSPLELYPTKLPASSEVSCDAQDPLRIPPVDIIIERHTTSLQHAITQLVHAHASSLANELQSSFESTPSADASRLIRDLRDRNKVLQDEVLVLRLENERLRVANSALSARDDASLSSKLKHMLGV
jgi:hypothetical protein